MTTILLLTIFFNGRIKFEHVEFSSNSTCLAAISKLIEIEGAGTIKARCVAK